MSLRYRALDALLAARVVPDPLLRAGSRRGAGARLRREELGGLEAQEARMTALVRRMSSGPVAEATQEANDQHYELPAAFFGLVLGPRRKYSGCLWPDGVDDLAAAEDAMLALTCERAGIADGMEILDLGCGWGSLSLWLAERYPSARILAVSNSQGQRRHIEAERERLGFGDRLEVVTADVNAFATDRRFDRVVSVEMFEHMRNWRELLHRVAGWLAPGGRAFVHVFSHRRVAYTYEDTWAAERFFTGGTMPSHDLLLRFADDLVVRERWAVPGTHYARTLRAWLARLDERRDEALTLLGGDRQARRLLATWRLFLLCTEQIWGWREGREWMVSHYLLEPRGGNGTNPLVRAT